MSKLTLYSYSAERCTATNHKTDAERLAFGYSTLDVGDHYGFPFSGDMLAVLTRGTETQKYKRRRAARAGLRVGLRSKR